MDSYWRNRISIGILIFNKISIRFNRFPMDSYGFNRISIGIPISMRFQYDFKRIPMNCESKLYKSDFKSLRKTL